MPKLDKNTWIVVGGAAAAISAAVLLFRDGGSSSQSTYDQGYAGVGGTDLANELDRLNAAIDGFVHSTTTPVSIGSTGDGTPPPPGPGTTPPPIVQRPPAKELPVFDPPPPPLRMLEYVSGGFEAPGANTPLVSENAFRVQNDFLKQQPKINPGTEIHLATGEVFKVGTL